MNHIGPRSSFAGVAAAIAAIAAFTSGCGDTRVTPEPGAANTPSAVPTATTAPPLPESYRYVITSTCGERGFLGQYRVDVQDNEIVAVKNLNADYPYEPRPGDVPTLRDLRAMAESAHPDAVVEYKLDENGYPMSLSLDPIPNGIDDEECYRVSHLQTTGA